MLTGQICAELVGDVGHATQRIVCHPFKEYHYLCSLVHHPLSLLSMFRRRGVLEGGLRHAIRVLDARVENHSVFGDPALHAEKSTNVGKRGRMAWKDLRHGPLCAHLRSTTIRESSEGPTSP